MYKLYKKSVQVATFINSLYKLQLVWVDLYKLQLVQIFVLLYLLYFKCYCGGRGPVRGPPHQLLMTLILFEAPTLASVWIASQ